MVSEQFDRCHGALLQYVEFLSSAVTPTAAYALLVPALDELVHVYHLDPEVIPNSLDVFNFSCVSCDPSLNKSVEVWGPPHETFRFKREFQIYINVKGHNYHLKSQIKALGLWFSGKSAAHDVWG